MASASVPERMHITSEEIRSMDISGTKLFPLEITGSKGAESVKELESTTAGEVLSKVTGKHGSVAFVVRRPGWPLCREEGRSLSYLAAREDKPLDGFGVFGVVKETGVDDEGLHAFSTRFFKFPLYRDDALSFYELVGKRKMGVGAFAKLIWNGGKMQKRMKEKGIDGNLVGEGLKQGGVVVFDKNGKQQYIYQEKTGNDIPVNDIVAAVKAVREQEYE